MLCPIGRRETVVRMQVSELDVFKDVPGYKAILKTVLRSQIQMLVCTLSVKGFSFFGVF